MIAMIWAWENNLSFEKRFEFEFVSSKKIEFELGARTLLIFVVGGMGEQDQLVG